MQAQWLADQALVVQIEECSAVTLQVFIAANSETASLTADSGKASDRQGCTPVCQLGRGHMVSRQMQKILESFQIVNSH